MSAKPDHKTSNINDVDYWITEWFKGDRRQSENTQQAYRQDISQFLWAIEKPFKEVTVPDIERYRSYLSDRSCSNRTIARKIACIRSFYRFLNRREETNLMVEKIEPSTVKQSVDKKQILTEKEVLAIICAAEPDKKSHILIRLLYLTALRISEALALRWRDFDEAEGGGVEAHVNGKGNLQRDVFIPDQLWADLKEMRGSAGGNDTVFPTLNRFEARIVVQKLAKAAKINKTVTPHSFRHAHISHALKNGATLAELRDQAGHANISTTSLYLHANRERATATRLKVK